MSLSPIEEDDEEYFDDVTGKASRDIERLRTCEEKVRSMVDEEHQLAKAKREDEEKRDSIFDQASAWLGAMWAKMSDKPDDALARLAYEAKRKECEELKRTAEARCRAAKDSLERHRELLAETQETKSSVSHRLRKSKMSSLARRAKKVVSGDLVFVMDCTGSMSSFIKAAADQCCDIIDKVAAEGGTVGTVAGASTRNSVAAGTKVPLNVRFGFVAYRDYDDGQLHLQHHDLTKDGDSVKRFIRSLQATGGGDGPEDVVGGLRVAARQLSWLAQHRTVFLFADAPNHGHLLHGGSDDSYPNDPRTKAAEADIPGIMAGFRDSNTDFFFVRINATYTDKMRAQLQTFFNSAAPSHTAHAKGTFNVFDLKSSAANFFDEVGSRAAGSMSRSFTTSMTSTRKGARLLTGPPPDLDATPPVWPTKAGCDVSKPVSSWEVPEGWNVQEVELSFCFMARHTDEPSWTTRKATLLCRKAPFACGAMRAAYYYYDPEWDEQLVGKRYLGRGAVPATYQTDIVMQHYAQCLAKDANIRLSKEGVLRAYNFVLPWMLRVPKSGETLSMEYLLKGNYKKWNNNNGWIDDSAGGLMAAAFSHFSHVATSAHAMVVDIQGVNGWCFTDPQVHCSDPKTFGVGNLGERGMVSFYLTHQCNTFCRLLGAKCEREELQPIQAVREVCVEERGIKAFCSICGCPDVDISGTELEKKAFRRHDIFCKKHFKRYSITLQTKECERPGCKRSISYSSWYVELRGQAPPSTCKACKLAAGSRATAAGMLIHSEATTSRPTSFAASTGLVEWRPRPSSNPTARRTLIRVASAPAIQVGSRLGSERGVRMPVVAPAPALVAPPTVRARPIFDSSVHTTYPSRDAYLASPEGADALQLFEASGKEAHGFKKVRCDFFPGGHCSFGRRCMFLHDEFPAPSSRPGRR